MKQFKKILAFILTLIAIGCLIAAVTIAFLHKKEDRDAQEAIRDATVSQSATPTPQPQVSEPPQSHHTSRTQRHRSPQLAQLSGRIHPRLFGPHRHPPCR